MDAKQHRIKITVTNIIAKISLQPTQLTTLHNRLMTNDSATVKKFNPHRFPAIFLRLSGGSCNLFASGTVVFLDYRTMLGVVDAVQELQKLMGSNLFIPVDVVPTVCNIACSFSMGEIDRINLSQLSNQLRRQVSDCHVVYEPDLSNGLEVHMSGAAEERACILIHSSGKGIIVGAKCQDTIFTKGAQSPYTS